MGTAASTANLLDDVEGHSCGKTRRAVPCHAKHFGLSPAGWGVPGAVARLCIAWGQGTASPNLSAAGFAPRRLLALLCQPRPPRSCPRCDCMAEMPPWAKTSFHLSQACSGRVCVPDPGCFLPERGNPCPGEGPELPPHCSTSLALGLALRLDLGLDLGLAPHMGWPQPPAAPICLCLSDEDFQARRQQLQEEEETPKEGQ